MDLIDWSLSALDKILSSRKAALEVAACPEERPWPGACGSIGSTYFVFGFLIAGFLLIGLGVAFVYRNIEKTGKSPQLSDNYKKKFVELSERLDKRLEREKWGITHKTRELWTFEKME